MYSKGVGGMDEGDAMSAMAVVGWTPDARKKGTK
jgi:hypothetical protein